MKTVGIIAEYNPFHNGHAYQIKKAKEITGADCAVVVMNGSFMQRGLPAFADKYTRTKMAIAGGADIVFELPVCFGLSSAEDFAFGSISLLDTLGFVDAVCFGSEAGNIHKLLPFARLFAEEPEAYRETLSALLKKGLGFPAAREQAAKLILKDNLNVLSQPNNLLGIEYLKALINLSSSMKPFTIARIGAGYHDTEDITGQNYPSASGLRSAYTDYPQSVKAGLFSNAIPEASFYYLNEALSNYRPLTADNFSESLYYALRQNTGSLNRFKDVSEDLADRIEKFIPQFQTTSEFARLLHTKQYTKSRIDRCLFQILLGIKKKENTSSIPLRLLGLRKEFSSCLKNKNDIIVKPAKAKEALATDFFASDLYHYMIYKTSGYVIESDYHHSPIIF